MGMLEIKSLGVSADGLLAVSGSGNIHLDSDGGYGELKVGI